MFFYDSSGLSLGLTPPCPPLELELPDLEKIYRHAGEGSFDYLTSRLNFLMEMTKFFPDYMTKMYAGVEVTDDDLNQFGHATADADQSSLMNWEGNDFWTGAAGRGFDPEYFGYGHPITFNYDWWGKDYGLPGSKNLDWNMAAYDDNCFKNKDTFTFDDPECDDPSQYYDITGLGSTDELGDYRSYLGEMKDYLKSAYGDKSYYEIAMSGINGTSFNIVNDSAHGGQAIDLGSISWGNFAYDGQDGKGAFLLMVDLLRSRRMIYQGMSEMFGPNSFIYNADGTNEATDNAGMLKQFEYTIQQKLGGADPNNKSIFQMFLAAQHYLHATLAEYSGGAGYTDGAWSGLNNSPSNLTDGGFIGWMRSARDMLAFKRFREWILPNAKAYAESQGDNAKKLYNEFTFAFAQPYGKDASSGGKDDGGWVGWDYYYHDLYTTSGGQWAWDNDPFYNYSDNGHNYYAISQLCNLSSAQMRGRALYNNGDGAVNMYNGNWVVHAAGRFGSFKDQASSNLYTTMAINFNQDMRYRTQQKEFDTKLQERKDQKKEEQIEEGRAVAKQAARLHALNEAILKKKHGSSKPGQQSKSQQDNRMHIKKVNEQRLNERKTPQPAHHKAAPSSKGNDQA